MKKMSGIFAVVFILITIPNLLKSQSSSQQIAPKVLWNYDGDGYCNFKFYRDGYTKSVATGRHALEGDKSLRINWRLRRNQYFGWILDLSQGDSSGSSIIQAHAISFKIQLKNGDEEFVLKLKDKNGTHPEIGSSNFLEQATFTQDITIPLRRFGKKIDLTSVIEISLDFDPKSSTPKEGGVLIDDFRLNFN